MHTEILHAAEIIAISLVLQFSSAVCRAQSRPHISCRHAGRFWFFPSGPPRFPAANAACLQRVAAGELHLGTAVQRSWALTPSSTQSHHKLCGEEMKQLGEAAAGAVR